MEGPNDNQDNYKWGFIYFNPNDSRVFVPKSVNWMGYTMNFANPVTYLVILGFILMVIFFE